MSITIDTALLCKCCSNEVTSAPDLSLLVWWAHHDGTIADFYWCHKGRCDDILKSKHATDMVIDKNCSIKQLLDNEFRLTIITSFMKTNFRERLRKDLELLCRFGFDNHIYPISDILKYTCEYQSWFSKYIYDPIHGTFGGIVPTDIFNIYNALNELVSRMELLYRATDILSFEDKYIPLLKRITLFQQAKIADDQASKKKFTTNSEISELIDKLMEPIIGIKQLPWWTKQEPIRVPQITKYVSLARVTGIYPELTNPIGKSYDDKFGILQTQSSFGYSLERARLESRIRGTNINVAFVDIDDFKGFNSRYTESVVDRDILPPLMQLIESHVYSIGSAFKFGGDEYVLLLPNMSEIYVLRFLAELQDKMSNMKIANIHEEIHISIGLRSISYDSCLTNIQVLQEANQAKKKAKERKNAGEKDCISYYEFGIDENPNLLNYSRPTP